MLDGSEYGKDVGNGLWGQEVERNRRGAISYIMVTKCLPVCGMWYGKWYTGKASVKRVLIIGHAEIRVGGQVGKDPRWAMLQCSGNASSHSLKYRKDMMTFHISVMLIMLALLPPQPPLSTASRHILDLSLLPSLPTASLISWKFTLIQIPPLLAWITEITHTLNSQFCSLPIFPQHVPTS